MFMINEGIKHPGYLIFSNRLVDGIAFLISEAYTFEGCGLFAEFKLEDKLQYES